MTWGRTSRGPRSINADDSSCEEERAAGGPGPGAVNPVGSARVLTDRTTAVVTEHHISRSDIWD